MDFRSLPYFTIGLLQSTGARGQRPQPGSEATVEEQRLSTEQHSWRNVIVIMRLLGGLNPSSPPPALSVQMGKEIGMF